MLIDNESKETLEKLIESINPNQFRGLTTKIKGLYPEIHKKLCDIARDLRLKNTSEAIYLVINGMDEPPRCEGLSENCTHKLTFKTITEGYTRYCKKCSSLSEDFKLKRSETNLDKYGTEFPNQNKEIKEKIRTAAIKRGVLIKRSDWAKSKAKPVDKVEKNIEKSYSINVPILKKAGGYVNKTRDSANRSLKLNFIIGKR